MAAWKLACFFLVLVVVAEALPSDKRSEDMETGPFLRSAPLAKAFLRRESLEERGARETLSRWGSSVKNQFQEWGSDIKDAWSDLKNRVRGRPNSRRQSNNDIWKQ